MKKRGTSLAMEIIVIAALLLIVMVVIGLIFGVSIGDFTTGFKNCEAKNGECRADCADGKKIFMADCPKKEEVCCLKD